MVQQPIERDGRYLQIGLVRGNIADCDGSRFPNIFTRLDNPEVLSFVKRAAFGITESSQRSVLFLNTLINQSF